MRNIFLPILFIFFFSYSIYAKKSPVDYVNPYMGNISHLLKPTYPTVHLPNGMLPYILNEETIRKAIFTDFR